MALRLTSTLLPSQTPVSSKGQTYTTAGTVYNPKSAQPLQPPARRGRSLKWTSGAFHGGLTLLPKSTLSSLALGLHGGARLQPSEQYSPLQQNYDRAVSPVLESRLALPESDFSQIPRHLPLEMTVKEANKYAMVAPGVDGESIDNETSDDEDDDLGMKPLLNMGVKSLQNLASYSNPNQKRAQKALERSARSVQSSMAANPSTVTTNGNASAADINDPIHNSPLELSVKRPMMPAHASSFGGIEMRPKEENTWKTLPPSLDDLKESHQLESIRNFSTLPTGPGAPQPLTAGPPGQRQYRRSAFDSTFKILKGRDRPYQYDTPGFSPNVENKILPSGLLAPAEFASAEPGDLQELVRGSTAWASHLQGNEPNAARSWESTERQFTYTTSEDSSAGFDEQNRFEQSHGWPSRHFSIQYPVVEHDAIRARTEAMDKLWRSGDRFVYDIDKNEDNKTSSFGAIGDRRPRSTKPVHEKLSIEEANSLPTTTHAKPLLQIALRTLEDPGFRSQWTTPDDSLINSSSSGNRSLWGTSAKGKMMVGRKTTRKA